MAEISGKFRQQTLYIRAAAIPGNQSMNYARMPQVMQPGLIAGAVHLRANPDMAMRYFTATNGYLAGVFLAIAIDVLVLG